MYGPLQWFTAHSGYSPLRLGAFFLLPIFLPFNFPVSLALFVLLCAMKEIFPIQTDVLVVILVTVPFLGRFLSFSFSCFLSPSLFLHSLI